MPTSPTVLVVDDEPDVCWALQTLLRRNGFTVVTMGGGAEALRWLKQSTPACRLILLDAKLADIEGVELGELRLGPISAQAKVRQPLLPVIEEPQAHPNEDKPDHASI